MTVKDKRSIQNDMPAVQDGKGGMLEVEVVYALPQSAFSRTFQVREGCTLLDAVKQSGVLEQYPDIKLADLADGGLGVYGELRSPDSPARAGERIEIYRPLVRTRVESRKRRRERELKP